MDSCSIPTAHEETPQPEVKDQSEPVPGIVDEQPQKVDPVELPGDEGTTSDGQAEQGTPLTETTVSQEDGFSFILLVASLDMILSKKRITKALIRLSRCAVWSAPVLSQPPEDGFSQDKAHLLFTNHSIGPVKQKITAKSCDYFFIHQFKHMFWVFKRTVSLRRFF